VLGHYFTPAPWKRDPSLIAINLRNNDLQALAPVIVLDGNQRSALAVVRSLGSRGVPVHVADSVTRPLAATSRFCTSSTLYPDAAASPEAFLRWLEDMARKHPQAVLMPMTDLTAPLVLEAGTRISGLRTALPELAAYEAVSDKYQLSHIAREVGVRAPATLIVSRENLLRLASQQMSFPAVVKPRRSATRVSSGIMKRPVRYAADAAELTRIAAAELLDDSDELLVQEYVKGFGAGVFALYDRGKPLFYFAHRRVREKPPSGGVSVVCESAPLPEEGVEAARRLLDALKWHGVAMVEFKIDADGRSWLIEINARFWGSLQLAVDCGADFPWFLYQIATGAQPAIPERYLVGGRLRWWLGDLDNLYARMRDRHWTPTVSDKASAVLEFLSPWQPRTRYEFLRWNDPRPAVTAFQQYFAALTRSRGGAH
jgi:predicted ATP-grasp superfamily ATP-dependent carboligase